MSKYLTMTGSRQVIDQVQIPFMHAFTSVMSGCLQLLGLDEDCYLDGTGRIVRSIYTLGQRELATVDPSPDQLLVLSLVGQLRTLIERNLP